MNWITSFSGIRTKFRKFCWVFQELFGIFLQRLLNFSLLITGRLSKSFINKSNLVKLSKMVQALIELDKNTNRVLNIVKAKYELKDKGKAIEFLV